MWPDGLQRFEERVVDSRLAVCWLGRSYQAAGSPGPKPVHAPSSGGSRVAAAVGRTTWAATTLVSLSRRRQRSTALRMRLFTA